MICKPDSILDDIWSKVKAVCIDYDLPDELRILKVMLRNKMSTGFCYLFWQMHLYRTARRMLQ